VFPDGSVEIMPTPAAIRKAQDLGLDLILIAPTAEPPVAKAMDDAVLSEPVWASNSLLTGKLTVCARKYLYQ
jgi:hypothetical protein